MRARELSIAAGAIPSSCARRSVVNLSTSSRLTTIHTCFCRILGECLVSNTFWKSLPRGWSSRVACFYSRPTGYRPHRIHGGGSQLPEGNPRRNPDAHRLDRRRRRSPEVAVDRLIHRKRDLRSPRLPEERRQAIHGAAAVPGVPHEASQPRGHVQQFNPDCVRSEVGEPIHRAVGELSSNLGGALRCSSKGTHLCSREGTHPAITTFPRRRRCLSTRAGYGAAHARAGGESSAHVVVSHVAAPLPLPASLCVMRIDLAPTLATAS